MSDETEGLRAICNAWRRMRMFELMDLDPKHELKLYGLVELVEIMRELGTPLEYYEARLRMLLSFEMPHDPPGTWCSS